jgi:hypothetical protein
MLDTNGDGMVDTNEFLLFLSNTEQSANRETLTQQSRAMTSYSSAAHSDGEGIRALMQMIKNKLSEHSDSIHDMFLKFDENR